MQKPPKTSKNLATETQWHSPNMPNPENASPKPARAKGPILQPFLIFDALATTTPDLFHSDRVVSTDPDNVAVWRVPIINLLVHQLIQPHFHFFSAHPGGLTPRNAERVAARALLFWNANARNALRLHHRGVFGSGRPFLLNFTDRDARSKNKSPLEAKLLEARFPSWIAWDLCHRAGVSKFASRCFPYNYYFTYMVMPHARGLFLAIAVHTAGMVGSVMHQIGRHHQRPNDKRHAWQLIADAAPHYSETGTPSSIAYELPRDMMDDFRKFVWLPIQIAIVAVAKRIVDARVQAASVLSLTRETRSSNGVRRLLNSDSCVTQEIVFREMFSPRGEGIRYWHAVAGLLVELFHVMGVSPLSHFKPGEILSEFSESVAEFCHHVFMFTMASCPSLDAATRRDICCETNLNRWVDEIQRMLKENPWPEKSADEIATLFENDPAEPTIDANAPVPCPPDNHAVQPPPPPPPPLALAPRHDQPDRSGSSSELAFRDVSSPHASTRSKVTENHESLIMELTPNEAAVAIAFARSVKAGTIDDEVAAFVRSRLREREREREHDHMR